MADAFEPSQRPSGVLRSGSLASEVSNGAVGALFEAPNVARLRATIPYGLAPVTAPGLESGDAVPLGWHRSDAWLAATSILAAALALPMAPGPWHAPELSAMLAVSATALAAGQRWAIGLIVLAELLLVPTVWPRAFFVDSGIASRLVALTTLAAIVPGVLAIPRAATALVMVSGRPRTQRAFRGVRLGMVALAVFAAALPLL